MALNDRFDEGHLMDVFSIPEMAPEYLDLIRDEDYGFGILKNDAIKTFVRTYNATYIRTANFSPPEIAMLRNKLWHNKVLIRLLDNLYIQKPYMVRNIEGPTYLKIYKDGEIVIYLFGEYHRDTRGDCNAIGRPHAPAFAQPPGVINRRPAVPPGVPQIPFPPGFPPADFAPAGGIPPFAPLESMRFIDFIEYLRYYTPSFFDLFVELGFDDSGIHSGHSVNTGFVEVLRDMTKLTNAAALSPSPVNYMTLPHIAGLSLFSNIARNCLQNNTNLMNSPTVMNPVVRQAITQQLQNIRANYAPVIQYELLELRSRFSNCFDSRIRKTLAGFQNCKLGRFHNLDARRMTDNTISVNPFQIAFAMHTLTTPTPITLQEKLNIYRASNSIILFRELQTEMNILPLDPYNITRAIFRKLLVLYPLLNKEYNRVDNYYRNRIEFFITTKLISLERPPPSVGLININTDFNDILDSLENFDMSNPVHVTHMADCETQINKLSDFLFLTMALVMDLYCLCRIFKKFQVKVGCQPKHAYNIIIYAGQAHAQVYSEFIEHYYGIRDVHRQLIPVPATIQPVFSHVRPNPALNHQSCVTIDLTIPANSLIVP